MSMIKYIAVFCLLILGTGCKSRRNAGGVENTGNPGNWAISPFSRIDSVNPVLQPSNTSSFRDPILEVNVLWEEKDVFNPAAVVKDGKVYLLYRAEDKIGIYKGTSRIGLAISEDGFHFKREPEPVFYPDEDSMKIYEWPGGCEDPRIVISADKKYFMTYTAYEGETARLCIAVSEDLVHWIKKGLAFKNAYNGKFKDTWSKSGSIICRQEGNDLVAWKVKGKYWMYWGDTDIFLASSDDLINWIPEVNENDSLKPVIRPRKGYFDSQLVEPGPPALITEYGILLIYNSMNNIQVGDKNIPDGTYSAGQALFDISDPSRMINRLENNFFMPEKEYEISGQINQVCFLEGLVYFNHRILLYYGTADSRIAVAVKN